MRSRELTSEIENVFSELAPDVAEDEIQKTYGIDVEYGYYTSKLSFGIIRKIVEFVEFQPEKAINVLTQLYNNVGDDSTELKDLLELLLRVANVYKILNSVPSYILDKPKHYSPGSKPEFIEDILFKTVIPVNVTVAIADEVAITDVVTVEIDDALNEAISDALNDALNGALKSDECCSKVEKSSKNAI